MLKVPLYPLPPLPDQLVICRPETEPNVSPKVSVADAEMRPTPTSPWLVKVVPPSIVLTSPGTEMTLGDKNCALVSTHVANRMTVEVARNRFGEVSFMQAI